MKNFIETKLTQQSTNNADKIQIWTSEVTFTTYTTRVRVPFYSKSKRKRVKSKLSCIKSKCKRIKSKIRCIKGLAALSESHFTPRRHPFNTQQSCLQPS